MAAFSTGVVLFVFVIFNITQCKRPNIVFILTDDEDVREGGSGIPIRKIQKLVGQQGITFNNMFVNSPLCCPSRSSILTSKYIHNHHTVNNSVNGNCGSYQWQKQEEPNAFPVFLKKQGYSTFFAGKYLNQYGFKTTGGPKHIPPGWDHWNGLIGNSRYYGYSESINGRKVKHGYDYELDYYTDVIHRRAMKYLQEKDANSEPFFMMLSTPACHGPFTPAPQYSHNFSDMAAPRDPIFNTQGVLKHWLIEQASNPMPNDTIVMIDDIFRNRWRTLQSVDDMVEDVINMLSDKELLENTFIIFSSDNGYHLGQFSMPMDKRQLYEFDIRVPLMIRGPGIKPGQTRDNMVMNIDLGTTFLDIAGHSPLPHADGVSLVPLFPVEFQNFKRTEILIEHQGETAKHNKYCPKLDDQGMSNCDVHCVCEDSWNNTYNCLRLMTKTKNYKYCQLLDTKNFVEVYELNSDVWEITNIVNTAEPSLLLYFKTRLTELVSCIGPSCYNQ